MPSSFRLTRFEVPAQGATLLEVYEAAAERGFGGTLRELLRFNGWTVERDELAAGTRVEVPLHQAPAFELGQTVRCEEAFVQALADALTTGERLEVSFPPEVGAAAALQALAQALYAASTRSPELRLSALVTEDTLFLLEPVLLSVLLAVPENGALRQALERAEGGDGSFDALFAAPLQVPDLRAVDFVGRCPMPSRTG